MKKKKNIFMRNQRKKLFKLKGFKQALSLVMVLLMCLVLLPIKSIEAAGETYTVYFDASNFSSDEWFTGNNLCAHGFTGKDVSGLTKMNKSSKGDNIYEVQFSKKYDNIIFTKGNDWSTVVVSTVQGNGMTIPWEDNAPCFKLENISGTNCTGTWYDLGGTTQPTTSFNSQYIYLDTTLMKANSNYDWNSNPQTHLKLNLSDDEGNLKDASGTVTIDGIKYVYWDASSFDTNKKFAIIYDNWNTTKSNDYTRTDYASVNVAYAKGHSFCWDSQSTTTIDGKTQYLLSKVKPQLNSEYVYLDVSGMNKTEDWTNKDTNLYMYVSTLDASDNNRLVKADGITTIEGKKYVYWDTSKITADTSGKIAFLCEDNWDNADTKDYYRTMNIDETTLETAKGNAYFWNGYDTFEVNGVLTYRLDRVDFDSTYESDYSNGDKSIDIPKTTGNKEVISNAYYASATFYDYYSDYEMKTGTNKKNCASTGLSVDDYKNQFQYFNRMIAQYYKNNSSEWNPLYFGDFWEQKNQGSKWSDEEFNKNWNLYKFNYYKNNSQNDAGSAYQGLVDSTLSDGKVTMGSLEVPYFNASFLRNKTTPLAAIYQDVDFPFTLNDDGYWEFDSAKSEYAVQLKESENDGYYLKRTGEEIKGMQGDGKTLTTGFFPFNDKGQSGNVNKLDYGFGMEMEIPFTLTSDGTVEMKDGTKDIEFNFSGDDDIWIFIDGKLVLDIGGDHGRVSGSINFNTQKAKVLGVKDANGNKKGEEITSFEDLLPKSTYTNEHKMKIFYMERGVWESNMKITFNFPKRNNLQVEKQVVIPEVDSVFDNAMENLKNTNFDFAIKNLATDDIEYTGSSSTEEKTKVFNSYTSSDKDSTIGKVCDVKASITTKDSKNVVSWYAPKEKTEKDGQDVTDKRLVKIYPTDSSGKKSYLNVTNTKDYLTFDVYNESSNDDKGTSPFIALVDSDGTRIGAWLGDGDYSYQNSASSIGVKMWKTMKVDLSKLEKSVLAEGTVAGFNFDEVSEIQFAYWNDVTIYLGEFEFNKTSVSTTGSGFTTDPSKINDYGSVKSKALSSANGAMYSLNNEEGNREVSGGTFGLTDGQTATFRDQFRKGSYIAIQEVGVDSNVFDTKWTLYEDGKEISSTSLKQTTDNVSQTQNVTSVKNIKGTEVKDGRTVLKTSKGSNVAEGVEQPENAIAFYRYDDPAGAASSVNLKAKYVNTLKTASITIKKSIKAGEEVDPNKEYKFEVSFDNVAGLGLEKNTPVAKKEFTLKPGEEKTISGIPVGTYCSIKEVKEGSDDFTLEEIKGVSVDGEVVDLTNLSLGTTINGDKSYEFVNSVYPTVGVKGEKNWEDDNSTERPETIEIQLQRRIKGSDSEFEIAKDRDGNQIENKIVKEQDAWKYSYEGLPKYVDYRDYSKGEYEYKVVEIKVGDKPVNESGYKPEYSTDSDGNLNITNKKAGSITIVKADSETEETITAYSAKFKIQKLKDDAINDSDFDTSFTEIIDSTENGVIKFDNLPMGTYLITEVEAPSGYIKLDKPFKITIPYEYKEGDIVDGKVAVTGGEKADITLKVLNPKGAVLPRAGLKGISLYLAIGTILVMVSGAFVLYKLNKDKKIN